MVSKLWRSPAQEGRRFRASRCEALNGSVTYNFSATTLKVFRYSFSEAIPIYFNRLKSGFFLVR